jgi:molybdopterin-dependent oxidoreductase alpha subunit
MKQNTEPKSPLSEPQDNAEDRNDVEDHPSPWQQEKPDQNGEAQIPANDPPRNSAAGPVERPSGRPHPIPAQQPEELTGLKILQPETYAAGLPGVIRAIEHIQHKSGLARGVKLMLHVNQKDGIDCTSCAWPDPDGERSPFEFCENGAKAVAWEADTRKADPEFFARHSVEVLANQSEYWLGQQGRLTHPMLLTEGEMHYAPISWEAAFAMIAEELNQLESPDEAIFYTSGRTSNEAAFVYQLFVREFGTNNMPDCSNMCHESSGAALTPTIGIGKGTVTINDFEKAQVILIIGQNPGTNHPRMLTTLERAKARGAKIVAINPLREAGLLRFKKPQKVQGVLGRGTPIADHYLQVRINGDVALLKGIMKELLAIDAAHHGSAIDWNFVREKTAGWDEFVADLNATEWRPLIEQSGIAREQMREVAGLLAKSDHIIACWAMGLTQHRNAVATIQEIVNLLLMRGSIGKPGAGACPVRGHSNVQGDRTMGVWERPREEFLNQLQKNFGFDPPRHHGYDTVESLKAMHAGKAKVFFAMGGNFASATPDTEYTAEALRKTRLTVHVSIKLNRAHLVTGKRALILPCLGRTEIDRQTSGEQFVSTENSMGVVQMSRGRLDPASEHLLSEPAIICRMARAVLGSRSKIDWQTLEDDYDTIRDAIARTIPGCDDYNSRVRQPGGFYLPNHPRDGDFANTTTKRANFSVHPLPDHHLAPGELVMTTVRSHDQFNTTVYGLDDHYRGIKSERRVVFMNEDDIRERGLAKGMVVDLTSNYEGVARHARKFVVVPYDIPKGNCATYFPEANVLVPITQVAEKSNTPVSKYVRITVKPAASN